MNATTTQSPFPLLTEREVRLFMREPVPFRQSIRPLVMSAAVFAVSLVAVYGIFNYNALLRVYGTDASMVAALQAPESALTPDVQQVASTSVEPTPLPAPTIPKNSVNIPDLGISAEIEWDVTFDEKLIQSKLPNSLVHFQGTAKPGQHGTVVITGHSSNYPWVKGRYNTVFAPLHKSQVRQTFVVNSDDMEYTYAVTKVYQVSPKELSVLQAGEKDGIRLITCTPIGTSLRRLIVEAEQISPSPSTNADFSHTQFTGSVPGAL